MRLLAAIAVALAALIGAPLAGQDRAGVFDHYVLALSWSPSWCALEGDAREAPICAPGSSAGFTLHGLWPQHASGWPEYCATDARDPSRRETAAMADIMGSPGLAWHQWVKHGRCSGLAPEVYFALSRAAFAALDLPELTGRTTPAALAAAVRARNPALPADGLVVTCRDGLAVELRLCLTRALASRPCAEDVRARACGRGRRIELPPPR